MRLDELLRQLAVDLNDAEVGRDFTGWSKVQLRFYILEGVREAMAVRPELFHETVVLTVEPGQTWQERCPCLHLTVEGVLGQSTETGRILNLLKYRPLDPRLAWSGPECPSSGRLREFTISPNGRAIRVYPSVSPGAPAHYLALRCAVWPVKDDDDDTAELPDELTAALLQWGQFRALMVDGESNQLAFQAAMQHKATFYELLNLDRAVRAATSSRPT
jgi:hypothetical protein